MSNTTSPSHRAGASSAGARSGRVIVGDFISRPAAEAARAVRRAGLRPGLERSFDCEAQLVGQIVAQEPSPGEELARGAMVMLYVGAPAAALPSEEAESHPEGHLQGSEECPTPLAVAADALQEAAGPPPITLKRRKPHHVEAAWNEPDAPPPEPRAPRDRSEVAPHQPVAAVGLEGEAHAGYMSAHTRIPRPMSAAHSHQHDPSAEELLSHADDVFAGRAGTPHRWRGRHARRGRSQALARALRWARRHPVLSATTSAMLVVWCVVGLHAAFAPASARTHTSVNVGLAARHSSPRRAHAPSARTHTNQPPDRVGSTRTAKRPETRASAPSRPSTPRPAASARPAPNLSQPTSTPAAAGAPPPASQAPEPQQRTGGPFSP